jgi:microcin C transport system permease protein
MMKNYLLFDFGKSYFRDVSVLQLIKEKLPSPSRSASG